MMQPWFDRRFTFEEPLAIYPCVCARLVGAPARLEELIASTPPQTLTRRVGEKWSIQENLGHLIELDRLHDARIDDYVVGRTTLSPADLENTATHQADYNRADPVQLLARFREGRRSFVSRLRGVEQEVIGRSCIHPRLDQPMRLLDMAIFAADHDDHHVAMMLDLKERA